MGGENDWLRQGECPKCGAKDGELCRSSSGKEYYERVHNGRVHLRENGPVRLYPKAEDPQSRDTITMYEIGKRRTHAFSRSQGRSLCGTVSMAEVSYEPEAKLYPPTCTDCVKRDPRRTMPNFHNTTGKVA